MAQVIDKILKVPWLLLCSLEKPQRNISFAYYMVLNTQKGKCKKKSDGAATQETSFSRFKERNLSDS